MQKGTPQELMEQGYYNRAESVCTGYAHQKKKKAKPKKWRLEREEKAAKAESRTGPQDRHPDAGGMVFTACLTRTETCCTKVRPQSW